MLTRVDVQSENPFYLKIRDAKPTDSIIVQKIDGLDPPDIDLFMGDFARDGGFYSGRRVPPRQLTIELLLNPNYKLGESVSGLRTMLYKAFLDPFDGSDSLTLILHDDELDDRFVSGNVSRLETEIFDEETIVMITMTCPNPYIQDLIAKQLPAAGPQLTFDYEGSAEAGFEVTAKISSSTSHLRIDLNGRVMHFSYALLVDDVVTINTIRGQRSVSVTRAGVTTSILYSLDATSKWLDIHSPSNVLKIYGVDSSTLVGNLQTLRFQPTHWGV